MSLWRSLSNWVVVSVAPVGQVHRPLSSKGRVPSSFLCSYWWPAVTWRRVYCPGLLDTDFTLAVVTIIPTGCCSSLLPPHHHRHDLDYKLWVEAAGRVSLGQIIYKCRTFNWPDHKVLLIAIAAVIVRFFLWLTSSSESYQTLSRPHSSPRLPGSASISHINPTISSHLPLVSFCPYVFNVMFGENWWVMLVRRLSPAPSSLVFTPSR